MTHPSAATLDISAKGMGDEVSRDRWVSLTKAPHFLRDPLKSIAWLAQGLVGTLFGIILLAAMAAVPLLNVLAYGYLLEIVGRVARTGRFRSACYLTPLTSRLAGIVIVVSLLVFPLRFLTGIARDASLVAPGGVAAWAWAAGTILGGLLAGGLLLLMIGRGGSGWWFFRPLNNFRWIRTRLGEGRYWQDADRAIDEVWAALRPWHHFRLGLIGMVGVYLWLALPTFLFAQAAENTGRLQTLLLILGGSALILVLGWLPFLQAHFCETGRWRAFLEWRVVRERFRRSPFCWTLSATLLFALSTLVLLYVALVKYKLPPHDALWDVMIVFLVTVAPAKILVAWAWHRSEGKPEPWRTWQWLNRFLLATALGYYIYFLFLARTGGQLGEKAIWQHHALILPFPF